MDNEQSEEQKDEVMVQALRSNEAVRMRTTQKSLYWFGHAYFPNYHTFGAAPFHKEMCFLLDKNDPSLIIFLAFRDAAKSTIVDTIYPLYEIMGTRRKKFVVIVSRTEAQAKEQLSHIRRELEDTSNKLLAHDLGPFKEESDEWGRKALVFGNYDAKITAVSIEQNVRGMRYKQWRPDLILVDDVEDLDSLRSVEMTDKLYERLDRDVIPAGDERTRIVVTGNIVAKNSVVMRLMDEISSGSRSGIARRYPFMDDNGKVAWPARYPTKGAVERERMKHGPSTWDREYMLKPVPVDDSPIKEEWLKYYAPEDLAKEDPLAYRGRIISLDPAISEKEHADCTAIVQADVYGSGENMRIYILPEYTNRRGLSMYDTVMLLKKLYHNAQYANIVVEDVSMQRTFKEILKKEGIYNVVLYSPGGSDKWARLMAASDLIQRGRVFFPPKETIKELFEQIVFFGSKTHDDLSDASSQLLLALPGIHGPMVPFVNQNDDEIKKFQGKTEEEIIKILDLEAIRDPRNRTNF